MPRTAEDISPAERVARAADALCRVWQDRDIMGYGGGIRSQLAMAKWEFEKAVEAWRRSPPRGLNGFRTTPPCPSSVPDCPGQTTFADLSGVRA